jgi:hypothetical protein
MKSRREISSLQAPLDIPAEVTRSDYGHNIKTMTGQNIMSPRDI